MKWQVVCPTSNIHNEIKSEHVAYEYILEAIHISKGSLSSPADWCMQAYNCQKSQIKM